MVVIDSRVGHLFLGPVSEEQERAARRALRAQIARLERELADCVVSSFPNVALDVAVASAAGPRVLGLGDLERLRDDLAERVRAGRLALERVGELQELNRIMLERMLAEPRRYKFARIAREDLGVPGCGAYEVRPRLGIVGMCLGWWQVKLSSGCPLATAGRSRPAAT
jgi:hypothetical protein